MFIELLLERRKAEYLKFVNLTNREFIRVRMIFLFFTLIVATGTIMFVLTDLSMTMQIGIFALAVFVGYKYPYIKLMKDKKNLEELIANKFPEFLQAFSTAELTQKVMYQTLKASVPFTPQPIKAQLILMLKKINDDGDKREHYMEFAKFVNTPDSYMIMDQIYKFSVQGYREETIEKLRQKILEIQRNTMDAVVYKKVSAMDTFGIIPLVASTLFILVFAGATLITYMNDALSLI